MNSNANANLITIYLVRHGESIGNLKRTFLPSAEDVLSTNGKLQVEQLGKALRRELQDHEITMLYSSNYIRAIETAEGIAAASQHSASLEIIQDERLQERNMGIFEGGSYQDALNALVSSGKSLVDYEVPYGETIDELYQRVSSFFQDLVQKLLQHHPKENEIPNVVIVSHSFALLKLLEYLTESGDYKVTGQNWDKNVHLKFLKNASYFKINLILKGISGDSDSEANKHEIQFLKIHETSHLKSLKSPEDELQKFANQQTNERAKKVLECVQA